MKKRIPLLIVAALAALLPAGAQKLVLLHTNDTHSQIEPTAQGEGGILQRKALMDSVRKVEKNVIAIDAGDGVQGSLYFKMFRGEADYPLMDMVGYDIRILGNHEFDNGLDELAHYWKKAGSEKLSANYDFSHTAAKGIFKPWTIKKVGGKKIGFFGINVNPESLIVADNYKGMGFSPAIATADSIAALLKAKGCDLVVAVTHIGYNMGPKEDDLKLARQSQDIDIIIGGHSHTLVNPATFENTPSVVMNSQGRPVLVVQTGKSGKYVGEISIDLKKIGKEVPEYKLIPVTDRFEESVLDPAMSRFIKPYKARVDSLCSLKVGYVAEDMENGRRTGAFPNWDGDFGSWYGNLKADSLARTGQSIGTLDLAVMNVGGIRVPWKKGPLDMGMVLSAFPFSNRYMIIRLKGIDLLKVMQTAASKGGEAISHEGIAVTDRDGNLMHFLINGEEVDPEKHYTVGTVDYLAWGNDDLREMANGEVLYTDDVEIAAPILRYLKAFGDAGIPVTADPRPRFITSCNTGK